MCAYLLVAFLRFGIAMNALAQAVEIDANAVEAPRWVDIEKIWSGRPLGRTDGN